MDKKLSSYGEMDYDNSTKVLIPAIRYSSNEPDAQKENRNIPLELFYKHIFLKSEWVDYIIDDPSWLRADTFSWHSGDSQEANSYEKVYQHLVNDIDGKTLQSETIAGITVQFYEADDKHKICPATEESNVLDIYNATGMAWYYILDEDNIRFKLPRENPNKELYQANAVLKSCRNGKTMSYGVGVSGSNIAFGISDTDNHFYIQAENGSHSNQCVEGSGTFPQNWSGMYTDLSDGTTYNRGKNYLYFYVGEYTMSSIENTAGQNMSIVNQKADSDLNNISVKIGRYTDLGSFTVAKNGEITFSESLSNFDYIIAKGDYYIMQGRNNGNNVFLSGFFSGFDIVNNIYYAQVYNVTLQYISGTKYKVASHNWADLYGTAMTANEISRSVRFYGIKIS